MKALLVHFLLILSTSAYAVNPAKLDLSILEKGSVEPSINYCPPEVLKDVKCKKQFDRLFKDGTVNITLAQGYFDSSEGVNNEYQFNLAKTVLTSPCPASYSLHDVKKYIGTKEEINKVVQDRQKYNCGGTTKLSQSCGFQRTDDPEIFQKKSFDLTGRPVVFKIRIINSAISVLNTNNIQTSRKFIAANFCQKVEPSKLDDCIKTHTPPVVENSLVAKACKPGDRFKYQICASEYVSQTWQKSISSGDEMVFYVGHARDGGGPDFEPPVRLKNGHTNYSWYQKHRRGHKKEEAAFKASIINKRAPVIYGSLSCNSKLHFFNKGSFPEVSPDTTFALSSRSAFGDENLVTFFSLVDGTLSKTCPSEMTKKVKGASCAFDLHNY